MESTDNFLYFCYVCIVFRTVAYSYFIIFCGASVKA